jgi:hypothetical protein
MALAEHIIESGLSSDALHTANVNPSTGLATDYLNHFNEAVMLLDMAGDMPELAEELLEWEPVSYEQHFIRTNYVGTETVVAAWNSLPHAQKAHFETLISGLDAALEQAKAYVQGGKTEDAIVLKSTEIEPLLTAARACVNGVAEIDVPSDASDEQAEIDALFD